MCEVQRENTEVFAAHCLGLSQAYIDFKWPVHMPRLICTYHVHLQIVENFSFLFSRICLNCFQLRLIIAQKLLHRKKATRRPELLKQSSQERGRKRICQVVLLCLLLQVGHAKKVVCDFRLLRRTEVFQFCDGSKTLFEVSTITVLWSLLVLCMLQLHLF